MDVFRILGAGARFDKKKYKQDVDLFENTSTAEIKAQNGTIIPSATDAYYSSAPLAPELDFFNTEKQLAESVKTESKNKVAKANEDADDEDDSLDPMTPEQVALHRKEQRIKVYGSDVPHPFRTFKELFNNYKFKSYIRKNVNSVYKAPTPIQMQSIPIMLHGREIIACAPTGSGKTLAFLLPILHDLKGPAKEGFRAVIISPTRELAQQIHRELSSLSIGKPFKVCVLSKATNVQSDQITESLKNFDILISTPLRLVHALQEGHIQLDRARHLVLDEADKLLELGFLEQMDEILAACSSPKLHKALFSATIPSGVEALAESFMTSPVRVVIGTKNAATQTISQKLLFVGSEEGKMVAIRQLIQKGLTPPVLIFVQSIDRAKELFHELVYEGINVDVMHSERTKAQRDAIIQGLRSGKIWVLITTELMARGIDFKGVRLVINYDFPQTVQSYIHRIGRTGRAGRQGEAVTYFTKEDGPYLRTIVNVMRDSGCDVPEWMLKLKKPSKQSKKDLKRSPLDRRGISTVTKYDLKKVKHKRQVVHDTMERTKKRKTGDVETTESGK